MTRKTKKVQVLANGYRLVQFEGGGLMGADLLTALRPDGTPAFFATMPVKTFPHALFSHLVLRAVGADARALGASGASGTASL